MTHTTHNALPWTLLLSTTSVLSLGGCNAVSGYVDEFSRQERPAQIVDGVRRVPPMNPGGSLFNKRFGATAQQPTQAPLNAPVRAPKPSAPYPSADPSGVPNYYEMYQGGRAATSNPSYTEENEIVDATEHTVSQEVEAQGDTDADYINPQAIRQAYLARKPAPSNPVPETIVAETIVAEAPAAENISAEPIVVDEREAISTNASRTAELTPIPTLQRKPLVEDTTSSVNENTLVEKNLTEGMQQQVWKPVEEMQSEIVIPAATVDARIKDSTHISEQELHHASMEVPSEKIEFVAVDSVLGVEYLQPTRLPWHDTSELDIEPYGEGDVSEPAEVTFPSLHSTPPVPGRLREVKNERTQRKAELDRALQEALHEKHTLQQANFESIDPQSLPAMHRRGSKGTTGVEIVKQSATLEVERDGFMEFMRIAETESNNIVQEDVITFVPVDAVMPEIVQPVENREPVEIHTKEVRMPSVSAPSVSLAGMNDSDAETAFSPSAEELPLVQVSHSVTRLAPIVPSHKNALPDSRYAVRHYNVSVQYSE